MEPRAAGTVDIRVLAVTAAVVLAGCGAQHRTASAPSAADEVLDRIAATSNCADLQAEFDVAMNRHDADVANGLLEDAADDLRHGTAADSRMRALSCY